jgi:putative PIN family toxin of toxin-antitoxin system
MRVVLDTNVLVSALLVQGSVPDRVVELAVTRRYALMVDSRIMAEYHDVLRRPEFQFDPALVARILAVLDRAEWIVAEPLGLTLPDPSDQPFLEVAVTGGADAIVTGNVRHFRFPGGSLAIPILTPRQLLQALAAG